MTHNMKRNICISAASIRKNFVSMFSIESVFLSPHSTNDLFSFLLKKICLFCLFRPNFTIHSISNLSKYNTVLAVHSILKTYLNMQILPNKTKWNWQINNETTQGDIGVFHVNLKIVRRFRKTLNPNAILEAFNRLNYIAWPSFQMQISQIWGLIINRRANEKWKDSFLFNFYNVSFQLLIQIEI